MLASLTAGAQTTPPVTPHNNLADLVYQKYGYLQGIGLDSFPAKHIQVYELFNGFEIDHGQVASSHQKCVTDSEGKRISFKGDRLGTLLNFLDYNGWEYMDTYTEREARSCSNYLLLKKKG